MAGLLQGGAVSASERELFWRGKLTEFVASGLSIRAFCRREGLAESAFYFWRRREIAVLICGLHIGAVCWNSRCRRRYYSLLQSWYSASHAASNCRTRGKRSRSSLHGESIRGDPSGELSS